MANVCLAANAQSGTVVVPLTVTLTVTNDCITIVANDISFGSAALLSQLSDISSTFEVTCAKGSSYTVGLSNGSYAVNGVRNMSNGSATIRYEIYKSGANARWGSIIASERVASETSDNVTVDGLTRP